MNEGCYSKPTDLCPKTPELPILVNDYHLENNKEDSRTSEASPILIEQKKPSFSIYSRKTLQFSTPSVNLNKENIPLSSTSSSSTFKNSKGFAIPPWKLHSATLKISPKERLQDGQTIAAVDTLDGFHPFKIDKPLHTNENNKLSREARRSSAFLEISTQTKSHTTDYNHLLKQKVRKSDTIKSNTNSSFKSYKDKSVGTARVIRRSIDCQTEFELTESLSGSTKTLSLTSDDQPQQNLERVELQGNTYHVICKIGQGGSSKVEKVLNFKTGEVFALKTVNLKGISKEILESYQQEIDMLEKLSFSDKVIKMSAYSYECSEKLLVLLECGDTDLDRFIKSKFNNSTNLNSNLTRYYWQAMLEAVQILHQQGIIHSDIKPANFLLVSGEIKLIDFGIAKQLDNDATSLIPENVIGTMNYMAPEVLKNVTMTNKQSKVGVKADVWSLGCILYLMTYGKTPFHYFKQQFGKIHAITSDDVQIEFDKTEREPLLIETLRMCLERDPKKRASIEELLSHPYIRYRGAL